ncbi:MAG: hypothetical protein U9Q90_10395 [Campylobacterota bacterium]|nr:hypothetical protein [Campylobacterota bacterium]
MAIKLSTKRYREFCAVILILNQVQHDGFRIAPHLCFSNGSIGI